MARIRTIKPEFWEDEAIAELSPLARLLFIGTWNLADDEGLLRWTPDYIGASLFMYDDLESEQVAELMDEVVKIGLVYPYRGVKSQRLAYILNFSRHQRINRPSPAKLPPPSLQQPAHRQMYADRDGWVCHLCSGDIVRPGDARDEAYGESNADQWLEIDHVVPKHGGGTDYPSNLRAAHRSCNRSKGHSLSDSLSDSVSDSLLEGKGREGKGREAAPAVARPSPHCAKHPNGTTKPCRACGDARRAHDAWRETVPGLPTVDEALNPELCPHEFRRGACPTCRRGGAT